MRVASFSDLVSSGELRNVRTVLTIGVFDGVHLGHRAILRAAEKLKKELSADISMAVTFSVNPKDRKGNIDTLRLRAEGIAAEGTDILAVIDFSPEFSKISACGFIDLLMKAVNPAGAAVGSDFRFGNPSSQGRAEDLGPMLRSKGADCRVEIVDSVLDDEGVRISSTALREMISKGELGCFPRFSGQFYRVDLVPLPYGSRSGELIFSRAPIHQLLPPPGSYDARLLSGDGKSTECAAVIDGESLRVILPSGSFADVSGKEEGKGTMLLDSLYLEKRR